MTESPILNGLYIPYGSNKTVLDDLGSEKMSELYIPYGSNKTSINRAGLCMSARAFISHMVQIKRGNTRIKVRIL